MKNLFASLAVAASLVGSAALACEGEHKAEATPKTVTVTQLVQLQKTQKVTPVDANGQEFRAKNGVIPGAVLLTSSGMYDPSKELPASKDASLVFYCASEKCGSSMKAASKAMGAGYTNVMVLPEGMAGWKKAGQKTAQPNS